MTKKELIERLVTYPDDMEIILLDSRKSDYPEPLCSVGTGYYKFDTLEFYEDALQFEKECKGTTKVIYLYPHV